MRCPAAPAMDRVCYMHVQGMRWWTCGVMAIGVSTTSPELSMRESGNSTGGGREWKSFTAWLSFDIYGQREISVYDSTGLLDGLRRSHRLVL